MDKNFKSKGSNKSEVVEIVGSPEKMINLLIADPISKKWAIDQIVYRGPKRKQVLKALLLNVYLN